MLRLGWIVLVCGLVGNARLADAGCCGQRGQAGTTGRATMVDADGRPVGAKPISDRVIHGMRYVLGYGTEVVVDGKAEPAVPLQEPELGLQYEVVDIVHNASVTKMEGGMGVRIQAILSRGKTSVTTGWHHLEDSVARTAEAVLAYKKKMLLAFYAKLDKNRDGSLTPQEVVEELDSDGNRKITLHEFFEDLPELHIILPTRYPVFQTILHSATEVWDEVSDRISGEAGAPFVGAIVAGSFGLLIASIWSCGLLRSAPAAGTLKIRIQTAAGIAAKGEAATSALGKPPSRLYVMAQLGDVHYVTPMVDGSPDPTFTHDGDMNFPVDYKVASRTGLQLWVFDAAADPLHKCLGSACLDTTGFAKKADTWNPKTVDLVTSDGGRAGQISLTGMFVDYWSTEGSGAAAPPAEVATEVATGAARAASEATGKVELEEQAKSDPQTATVVAQVYRERSDSSSAGAGPAADAAEAGSAGHIVSEVYDSRSPPPGGDLDAWGGTPGLTASSSGATPPRTGSSFGPNVAWDKLGSPPVPSSPPTGDNSMSNHTVVRIMPPAQTLAVRNLVSQTFRQLGFRILGEGEFEVKDTYWLQVSWSPSLISWAEFRSSMIQSLRSSIVERWRELGLKEQPHEGHLCIQASSSPFEALAERLELLEMPPGQDPFGASLLSSGLKEQRLRDWAAGPQVALGHDGSRAALFSVLENMDAEECLRKLIVLDMCN